MGIIVFIGCGSFLGEEIYHDLEALKDHAFALTQIGIFLVMGAAIVVAREAKAVSSYGPTNQDVSF
jgi:hypothetical protein